MVNEGYVGSERAKLKTFAFYNLLGNYGERANCVFPWEKLLDLTSKALQICILSNIETCSGKLLNKTCIDNRMS